MSKFFNVRNETEVVLEKISIGKVLPGCESSWLIVPSDT